MSEPVDTDQQANAAELLARAAQDFAEAQARRDQLSAEDRVNGQQTGGGR